MPMEDFIKKQEQIAKEEKEDGMTFQRWNYEEIAKGRLACLEELKEELKKSFNFAEWLHETTCSEDMDSVLCFITEDDKSISIFDAEYRVHGNGKTLEEACKDFEREHLHKYKFSALRSKIKGMK